MSIISIIGSGGMAAAIGGLAAKAGHTVEVMSRDAAKARALTEQVGAGAHVVKAFNTIFGHVLAKGGRLDAFIAADDADAKASVSTFLESLGLRPLDVGGLRMAQTLEALGLMMIGLAKNGAGTWDIAMNVDIGSNRL